MFAIDLSSKRAKLALRFFTYGVMTISTIVISVIVIFFALGYRLDRNFHFSQGGLVQFRSFPEDAEVTVDGMRQDFKTPNKLNMTAGRHTVNMNLKGYLPWNKTISVEPGQLLWLNYTRFIPESITTTNIRDYDSLADMSSSPDRHWLVLQLKADHPDFVLVDTGNEKEPKYTTFQLPENQLTKKDGKFGTFQIIEWDLGSRFILVKHEVAGETEYLRLDRTELSKLTNISREFRLPIREAHFSGNNPNLIFANTEGVLRRLDLSNSSASGALVNGLRQFVVYGSNAIAFSGDQEAVSSTPKQQVVGIFKDDKVIPVRTVPVEQQVILAYAEYDSHDYLAISHSGSTKTEVIRGPSAAGTKEPNAIFAQFDLQATTQWLSFSNNGRMVVAQNGNKFASYDLEEGKSYQKTMDGAITSQMKWLDDFYLWTDADGSLRIVEFDGENGHEITRLQSGFGVMLGSDGKRLFSVNKDNAGVFHLQSSRLTIND